VFITGNDDRCLVPPLPALKREIRFQCPARLMFGVINSQGQRSEVALSPRRDDKDCAGDKNGKAEND